MHAASLPADSRPGLPERAIVGAIAGYRLAAGPVKLFLGLQGCCRYSPTCSHYWEEAVRLHGAGTGSFLGARRLLRCHPWGGEGYDPVPSPTSL